MVKRKLSITFVVIIIFTIISTYFLFFSIFPAEIAIIKDYESIFELPFSFGVYVRGEENDILRINGKNIGDEDIRVDNSGPFSVRGVETGAVELTFNLFKIIPIRTVKVDIIPEIKVVPGGQAIGVLMRSDGVMVVGDTFVETVEGEMKYPAREAGVKVGDVILQINGQEIYDKVELAAVIQQIAAKNKSVNLVVKKPNGHLKQVEIRPVRNRDGIFMIGLYVDDGVAGVGTLTYFSPETMEYGALGHVITESSSQLKIDVREGRIVEARIAGINYGQRGVPGEKLGTFFSTGSVLGNINKNTEYGIFGKLDKKLTNPFFESAIPVAASSQVKRGTACVYTVVKEGTIEEFEIVIERVFNQTAPDSRGMIINITDPELKRMTGGIIQGMSGSPIVQEGRLVGAVTHVFINDPTRGYGIFAEWMLRETEIYQNIKKAG